MNNKIIITMLLVAYSQSMSAADSKGVYAINLSNKYFYIKANGFIFPKSLSKNMKTPVQLSSHTLDNVQILNNRQVLKQWQGGAKVSSALIVIQQNEGFGLIPFDEAVITYPSLKGTIAMAQDYVETGLYVYIINKTGAVLSVKDKPGFKPTEIPDGKAAKVLMRAPTKITPGGSVTLSASRAAPQTLKRTAENGQDVYGYTVSLSGNQFNIKPLNKLATYKDKEVIEAQAKEKK